MVNRNKRRYTLADYQKFVGHKDPIIRNWAVRCIEEQYPNDKADSFAELLTDNDRHLQVVAAEAIGNSNNPDFEPALRAAWSASHGAVRNWMTVALGQLQSEAVLPHLLAELKALPDQPPERETNPFSVAEALGHYPKESARQALWALFERYPAQDRLTFSVVEGLLRFIEPAEIGRLVHRWGRLNPSEMDWWHTSRALADAGGVNSLFDQVQYGLEISVDEVLFVLESWFLEEIPFSNKFLDALEAKASGGYAGVWPHLLAELEQTIKKRNDDVTGWLATWQKGERPTGYRWRMVYIYQLLSAWASQPPVQPQQHREGLALALALLAQAVMDEDDEAALQAAPNEMFRQMTLLNILSSTRFNVLPDIVEKLAALGPAVVPHLIEALEKHNPWAWLRALATIAIVARQHPGSADSATPSVLDLIEEDQTDEVLDAASAALVAIGPRAANAIGRRLGQDYTYDIFAGSALANIPTTGAAEAFLRHLRHQESLEEYDLENLATLGHPAAISFLRENFDWRNDEELCTVLHTLAVATGYKGPETELWRTVALKDYQEFQTQLESVES